jgi:hypothetical protein
VVNCVAKTTVVAETECSQPEAKPASVLSKLLAELFGAEKLAELTPENVRGGSLGPFCMAMKRYTKRLSNFVFRQRNEATKTLNGIKSYRNFI